MEALVFDTHDHAIHAIHSRLPQIKRSPVAPFALGISKMIPMIQKSSWTRKFVQLNNIIHNFVMPLCHFYILLEIFLTVWHDLGNNGLLLANAKIVEMNQGCKKWRGLH